MMKIILMERVEKLGQIGDEVTVKDGYARNFLLPKQKAIQATKANRQRFESGRVQLETQNLELQNEAAKTAEKMAGVSVILIRQASDTGQLYGSVNARDVAEAVTEAGYTVDRHQLSLERPIKSLGLHTVNLRLHAEVATPIRVNVARSEDAAEVQAAAEAAAGEEGTPGEFTPVEESFEDTALAPDAATRDETDADEPAGQAAADKPE